MKIKMQSEVKSITRLKDKTTLELEFSGKEVIGTHGHHDKPLATARVATFNGTLELKTVMADELKVGSVFTIVLSDEEPANLVD